FNSTKLSTRFFHCFLMVKIKTLATIKLKQKILENFSIIEKMFVQLNAKGQETLPRHIDMVFVAKNKRANNKHTELQCYMQYLQFIIYQHFFCSNVQLNRDNRLGKMDFGVRVFLLGKLSLIYLQ